MVDTRSEAVGVEKRPFSRNFSKPRTKVEPKTGGAKGGAPSYLRRTDASLARLSWSGLSALSLSGLWWFRGPVVHALLVLWFMRSWSCGATCSLEAWVGGESGRRTGDADWRRSSAGCVVRTCASVRGAPERARRPRERLGIRRGHASCRGDGTSRLADL